MTRKILSAVGTYYTAKLERHGPTPEGVDWKNAESQVLRFEQLHKLFDREPDASVIDFGCGYGAFLEFLRTRGHRGAYCGIDVSDAMIASARSRHEHSPDAQFLVGAVPPSPMDFLVSSGIFNVRMRFEAADWERYMTETLQSMDSASIRGFAFNCLTSYSDPAFRREDLYYGDPCYWFDFCRRSFSRNVSLLHDYELYEFTILVRKSSGDRNYD